ncbi:MAG: glycosyltransferase family 4 protein [Nitrospirae bacterium]|nr:glycosyltransferase family 4 protein [Nitrospirota bacterium]MBF0535642.1 glycosyltransferase family 4 protein [Nitrospirota bacterium]MBF0616948.1 glycosyltransferase family 4 protein [Nitrospirota bacterium]
MRLGVDCSNLRAGGGITHLIELFKAADFKAYGFSNVTLWGGRDTLSKITPKEDLTLCHEPMLDKPLPYRLYWQNWVLPELAARFADILFVPGGNFNGDFKPFVTMARNLLPFETRELLRYGPSFMALRLLALRKTQINTFRKAAGVIFLTEYTQKKVFELSGKLPCNTIVIPHGVSPVFRNMPDKNKVLSTPSPFKWLYVSIVDVYKHQGSVIRAISELREKGYPVTLSLVGSYYKPSLNDLMREIRKRDPNNEFITYKEFIPYEKLSQTYREADGFVFASSCETISNILLEAMSAGLPIACSDMSSMKETLKDGGVYFNPEEVESITSALRTLMDTPELRYKSALRGFELSESYTWQRTANETFAFIAGLCND